ncbi:hypothetical protein ACIQUC_16255 [Curtobacterium sp. NPDC098951]|uniref:hypothetical protein n=1 Tax=Curtobacterium sp. NPDC098951 TaxID=3363974 RepID=UPI0037F8687B
MDPRRRSARPSCAGRYASADGRARDVPRLLGGFRAGASTRITLAQIHALLKQHSHKTNVDIVRIDVKRAQGGGVGVGVGVMLADGTVTFLPVGESE